MQVKSIADVTPNGVATALGSPGLKAIWIALSAPVGNSSDIRYGDALISATRGARVRPGDTTPAVLPRCDFEQGGYDLSQVFVFGSGADSVSITYGE